MYTHVYSHIVFANMLDLYGIRFGFVPLTASFKLHQGALPLEPPEYTREALPLRLPATLGAASQSPRPLNPWRLYLTPAGQSDIPYMHIYIYICIHQASIGSDPPSLNRKPY